MDKKHILTDPEKLVKTELKNQGIDIAAVQFPKRIYLFADMLYDMMKKNSSSQFLCGIGGGIHVLGYDTDTGFVKSAMCSPAIAIQAEDLIACGVQELIHLGFAGAIQPDLSIGEFVVSDGAFHDTAVAGLYGFDETVLYADHILTEKIKTVLDQNSLTYIQGLHWTTDAGYHETWGQILEYRRKNALCVEMEGAGLFAIAQYRKVYAAAVYIISDILGESGWTLGWNEEKISDSVFKLIDAFSAG